MHASAISLDISPTSQVQLGAAGAGDSRWLGVAEPIEANFLVLWPETGDPILIVTVDLLYPGRILRAAVEAAAHPLRPAQIFLAASHTHRAPMTDDTKPGLGTPDPDYIDWLRETVSAAVRSVLQIGIAKPVVVSAAQSIAAHSINRRRKKLIFLAKRPRINAFINAPNPRGTTDDTLITVSIRRANGDQIAVLWNYACHPVAYPQLNTVAAHFPHPVRDALRVNAGNGELPVLYFQGFSGNTRPSASARVHTPLRFLRRIVSGPLFEDMTGAAYEKWSESLTRAVLSTILTEREVASDEITVARVTRPGSAFVDGLKSDVSFHGLHIGPEFSILAVSGEVVAEYAGPVRSLTGAKFAFCVGCIDDTFGYIPTHGILQEGGYEGGGYCKAFGLGAINERIEEEILSGFRAVAGSG
ncbi:hypothetical protein [Cryobacterium sp. Y50]|uniref:hypothetical protein n=1 Tax=Cryobacterium sp. Y50 TaxID=2048286 RepID=UPI000CE30F7D|nr:hypothetical protein [Cryobacterium sp. Y50]